MRSLKALICVLALLLLLPLSGPARDSQALPSYYFDETLVISNLTTLDGWDIEGKGDIIVSTGGRLVIKNSEMDLSDPARDSVTVTVETGAALEINDTTITSTNSNLRILSYGKLVIRHCAISNLHDSSDLTDGGMVAKAGNLSLLDSSVTTGGNAVVASNATVLVDNCTFGNVHSICVRVESSTGSVKDCSLQSPGYGIWLDGCVGFDIENLTITAPWNDGLHASGITDSSIVQVRVTGAGRYGAWFEDCRHLQLRGLKADGSAFDNIFLRNVTSTVMNGCEAISGDSEGIVITQAQDLAILDSKGNGNTICGIYLEWSSNITILGGAFKQNMFNGLTLAFCSNVDTSGLTFETNEGTGLYAMNCRDVAIRSCSLSDNYCGIGLFKTNNTEVSDTKVLQSDSDGVYVEECDNVNLSSLEVTNNNGGVVITDSYEVVLGSSNISASRGIGLGAYASQYITLKDVNVSMSNMDGVRLSNCWEVWGQDCAVFDSAASGLVADSSYYLKFSRLAISSYDDGLRLESSYYCEFDGVSIESGMTGINLVSSESNMVTGLRIHMVSRYYGDGSMKAGAAVVLASSDGNDIADCAVTYGFDAVQLDQRTAVFLSGSSYNRFSNMSVAGARSGAYLDELSNDNKFYSFSATGCVYGIQDTASQNEYVYCYLMNNTCGMHLSRTSYGTGLTYVMDSQFTDNYIGLESEDRECEVKNCLLRGNEYGYVVNDYMSGSLVGNTFRENVFAIYFGRNYYYERDYYYDDDEVDKVVYSTRYPEPSGLNGLRIVPYFVYWVSAPYGGITDNNFIRNGNDTNLKEDIYEGVFVNNFWTKYNGKDTNGDLIGDTDLPASHVDYQPRTLPFDPQDSDGDGFNDLAEDLCSSDPRDNRSVPKDVDGDGVLDGLREGRSGGNVTDDDDDVPAEVWTLPPSGRIFIIIGVIMLLIGCLYAYYRYSMQASKSVKKRRKR